MPAADSISSRVLRWEWMQAVILAANLAWTTLCLGGYRPETMVMTSALTGALLVVHCAGRMWLSGELPAVHRAGWWTVPFLIYAAANVLWVTPVRWLGWFDWFGWAQMIAVLWVVLNGVRARGPQRLVFFVLMALAVAAVFLAGFQRFVQPEWMMLGRLQSPQFMGRASGPFGIPNSLAAFLLLLLPVAGAQAFRRGTSAVARVGWAWITGVLAFGLLLTLSRGAWLGLALALMAWPLASPRWTLRRRLAAAAVVGGAIILAGVVLYQASPKARARLAQLVPEAGERTRPIMWRAAWKMFQEHPGWGSGAGSYNVRFEKYRPEGFNDDPRWAHNDYLNTLADYGGVGFVLFFGACGVLVWQGRVAPRAGDFSRPAPARRSSLLAFAVHPHREELGGRGFRSALGIGMLAFALQLFVDFHFKIPALAMTFATVAALAVGRGTSAQGTAPLPASTTARVAWSGAAVGTAITMAFFFWPMFRGEALRHRAREKIDQLASGTSAAKQTREELDAARANLLRATTFDPTNAQSWADRAFAGIQFAALEPEAAAKLGAEAEIAAERALALAPACADFWLRRSVARDLQGRWLDAGNDTTQALALAPNSAAVWYYHAFHLSHRRSERWLADAALAFCLRLDPWNPAGLALRQRLAISRKPP